MISACGGGNSEEEKDTMMTGTSENYTDSIHADTLPVSEADSTNSYRNDMGTDSINKTRATDRGVPRNP